MFVAAGFNSIGIQSAGGAGKVLADWIVDGHPPMDLWDVDVRRMMPFQRNRSYLHDRTVEALGLLYAMHWPYRQPETARGVRRSPVHDRLAARSACFGETAGWERANWFAPDGVTPEYRYSYGRQNWFEHSAAEHHADRRVTRKKTGAVRDRTPRCSPGRGWFHAARRRARTHPCNRRRDLSAEPSGCLQRSVDAGSRMPAEPPFAR